MGEPPIQLGGRGQFSGRRQGLSRNRIAVAFAIGLALLAGTTFVALRSEFEQPIASTEPEMTPEELNDIAPAAGPSGGTDPTQPAANIDTWGTAPSLQTSPAGSADGD